MSGGTGYYARPSAEQVHDLMLHRRRQLEAVLRRARKDDEEAQRELAQLEAEIAAGVARLEEMEEGERAALGKTLHERIGDAPIEGAWGDVPVERIMTRDVVTLREEDDLGVLQSDVDLTGHRAYPVMDGPRAVGLVTHRDVLRATHGHGQATAAVRQTFVATIMRRKFPHVLPTATLREVAGKLIGHDAPCVLVLDEASALQGIVTKDDVLAFVVQVAG